MATKPKAPSFAPTKGPKSVTIQEALAIANAMAGGKKVPSDAWAPANARKPNVTTTTAADPLALANNNPKR